MPKDNSLPDWEKLLYSAAHLQKILPEAVLVGGTAVATHVHHRLSYDADHVIYEDILTKYWNNLNQLQDGRRHVFAAQS